MNPRFCGDRLCEVPNGEADRLHGHAPPTAAREQDRDLGPGFVFENDSADIVVDALIGYGLTGPVREPAESLIRAVNRHGAPVVSLDVPSGVDATTGETLGDAVEPDRTVTLALPKTGLRNRVEPVFLADIGIPRAVYERLDIEYEGPFDRGFWVELRA